MSIITHNTGKRLIKHWELKKTIYVSMDSIYSQINISTLCLSDGTYLFDQNNFLLISN